MSSVYDWSVTAANNANSDGSINWAEGQPPSTVNNSARVMMARIKELLNDLGGISVATGTANAISVSVSSAVTTNANGIVVTFRAANTNSGAATLNVNTIGAKPLVRFTFEGEKTLTGGEVQQNCIYEAIYCSVLSGGNGAWLLTNPTEIERLPAGLGAPYFGGTVPSGWLLCNGAAISRTTYAKLFAAIGTTWGTGNGTTTFNLPDGRNDFIRGASSTLPLGTRQADAFKSHTHDASATTAGAHTHNVPDGGTGGGAGAQNGPPTGGTFPTQSSGAHTHIITVEATGSTETRPRNIAANWIIKT